jgi:hypothetical protein
MVDLVRRLELDLEAEAGLLGIKTSLPRESNRAGKNVYGILQILRKEEPMLSELFVRSSDYNDFVDCNDDD